MHTTRTLAHLCEALLKQTATRTFTKPFFPGASRLRVRVTRAFLTALAQEPGRVAGVLPP
eukprot:15460637-Alexandrium_andersonii.AAC.1